MAGTIDDEIAWTHPDFVLPYGHAAGYAAVKETEVIAVEAIEGTDRMIERAGKLCPQGGWTLVKVAKPDQDMRFDVPTVGPDTIINLKRGGAGMLVIEAGKTVIVDRPRMVAEADTAGIVILSRVSD